MSDNCQVKQKQRFLSSQPKLTPPEEISGTNIFLGFVYVDEMFQ